MKTGLEKEFFVLRDGKPCVIPAGVSYDESGILAEARGDAFTNPVDAVFSLQANVYKVQEEAKKAGVELSDAPFMKIPREVKQDAARRFAKGIVKHENLYGHRGHRNSLSEATAGVHISFTKPNSVSVGAAGNTATRHYNEIFDYIKIFRTLDKEFAEEIKAAKRRPGFYELKPDGRIEYRSLPANVDLEKVMRVLRKLV